MTMSATLAWPVMAVLGFVVLTCLVVALGTSSTARYEFEHNGARERQGTRTHGNHPAGSRHGHTSSEARAPTRSPRRSTSPSARPRRQHRRTRLVAGRRLGEVLAGPFADRIDADWAALADGLPAVAVHGVRRGDGVLTPRPSPEEQAFFSELGDQLERLPRTGTPCCRTPTR